MSQDVPYTQGLWILSSTAWQCVRKATEDDQPLRTQLNIQNDKVLDIPPEDFWNETLTSANPLYEPVTLIVGSIDRDKYDQKSSVLYSFLMSIILILVNI